MYSTAVEMSSTFCFFLHIVNCLSIWMSLSGVWKLFVIVRSTATCQTIIWNCYLFMMRFCRGSSVCLFVNSICSWSEVILLSLALRPLLYQNLLIMSFKVSHSHDYFGTSWSVRCTLWLKCGLWPCGLESLSHVSVSAFWLRKLYHEFCVVVCYILNINILSVLIFHACLVQQNLCYLVFRTFSCVNMNIMTKSLNMPCMNIQIQTIKFVYNSTSFIKLH